jgi:hypothetical protein
MTRLPATGVVVVLFGSNSSFCHLSVARRASPGNAIGSNSQLLPPLVAARTVAAAERRAPRL